MAPDEQWLAAVWPFVCAQIPAAPAQVVELGCGPLGGFVPRLQAAGYEATGVDPEAPSGTRFHEAEFEHYDAPESADAIVACTSLHHVANLSETLDRMGTTLAPGGVLVVVEWARECFDDATARWCFDRLPEPESDPGWLHQLSAEWRDGGRSWDACCQSWAAAEGLHAGHEIVRELSARFDSDPVCYGPYFFSDLAATTETDEQAAIDAGQIQATRIQYVGHKRRR